jgi:hypothetical protein
MISPARRRLATRYGVVLPVLFVTFALASCDPVAPSGVSSETDLGLSRSTEPQEEMFTLVTDPRLTSAQDALLAHIRSRPGAEVVRIARIAASPSSFLQRDRAVSFTLAPGQRVVARGQHTSTPMAGALSWAGALEGEEGVVNLVTVHGVPKYRSRGVPIDPFPVFRGQQQSDFRGLSRVSAPVRPRP